MSVTMALPPYKNGVFSISIGSLLSRERRAEKSRRSSALLDRHRWPELFGRESRRVPKLRQCYRCDMMAA